MLAKNKSSVFANLRHKIHVMYSRKFSRKGWEELAAKLAEHRAAHQTEAGGQLSTLIDEELDVNGMPPAQFNDDSEG